MSRYTLPTEAQIGLALRILFGLGVEEIAEAFLTSKETIQKRLFRAKEKLREVKATLESPLEADIEIRLHAVISTLYLLFNEGCYSATENKKLRKDICLQAMHLSVLLTEQDLTNKPFVNAFIALMCFHASRFEARLEDGNIVLWHAQDRELWNKELIKTGETYMQRAATGDKLTRYHLEAAIAYWHTQTEESVGKWRSILDYYNILLQVEYSPIAALNRIYALSRVENPTIAIEEALKLRLENNALYFALLGELYATVDRHLSKIYFNKALGIVKNEKDKIVLYDKVKQLGF